MNTQDYQLFLQSKTKRQTNAGHEVALEDIHPALFQFQRDIVRWAVSKGRAAIFADTGLGKALSVVVPVLTPKGYKAMGEIEVGDFVIGSNGTPTEVIGVYPQGNRSAYKITFSDGVSTVCDGDHLWSVRSKVDKYRGKAYRTMTTLQILESGLISQEGWKWFIPMVDPIEFEGSQLPLDSYLLGVILGDGSISQRMPSISSADEELLEKVATLLPEGLSLKYSSGYDWNITQGKRNGHSKNPLVAILESLALMGTKSATKFIPEQYLFATVEDRLKLLQGLMDTDGYCAIDGNMNYCTVSHQLAKDVAFIVQTLGGKAAIRTKKTSGQLAYQMSIVLPPDIVPFTLTRKLERVKTRTKYQPTRAIVSIEEHGTSDMVCIKVNAGDSLFVIEHAIVTHNTLMQSEWTRHFEGKRLIVAPLGVTIQTPKEAMHHLGLEVRYVTSSKEMDSDGVYITNYEKAVKHFDFTQLSAIVLDESSILKSLQGKMRRELTDMAECVPYRLCCTATPAPNDVTELGRHAEFLGVMKNEEMLARFFVNDPKVNAKTGGIGGWRLKGHASEEFYKWLASWAIAIMKPSDLGYDDTGYDLPSLTITPHFIESNYVPAGQLFFTELKGVTDRAKVRQGTLEERCAYAATLVNYSPQQWLVWHGLNEEGDLLNSLIPDSEIIEGSTPDEKRLDILERFLSGETRVLITKPKIFGFGMNFQHCYSCAFVGIDDSFESLYQSIRRVYRFRQVNPVNVEIILSDVQRGIFENVAGKQKQYTDMMQNLVNQVRKYEIEELRGMSSDRQEYSTADDKNDFWHLMLGDSCERMAEIPDETVHLTVSSIPFGDRFVYSDSPRDLGNSDDDEFYAQLELIAKETLRITKKGRNCAIHVQQIRTTKTYDGVLGLQDFRGDVIRCYQKAGWVFYGETTIDKNPQTQATRTKHVSLLFHTLRKDSAMNAPALGDYILLFKKAGENEVPIHPDCTEQEWIEWAHPVWYDIRETAVLNNYRDGKGGNDERHICPLQLPLIARAITLWSNRGEVIFDPFAGIASTLYEAIRLGRKGLGIELKPEYYKVAMKNLRQAKMQQHTLFDVLEVEAMETLPFDELDTATGD